MKSSPPLDIEAIRVRLASANPFGVPRWVASDVGHLLAEVVKLRAEVVTWLRAFAAVKTSGPVSPVRRIEQTFASRSADTLERGEHVPVPATSSEESGET